MSEMSLEEIDAQRVTLRQRMQEVDKDLAKLNESIEIDRQQVEACEVEVASVPEPSVLALLSLGLFGIGIVRRKKV